MATKARELTSDPRRAKPAPKARAGRVRLDALLAEQKARYRELRSRGETGRRVWVETTD